MWVLASLCFTSANGFSVDSPVTYDCVPYQLQWELEPVPAREFGLPCARATLALWFHQDAADAQARDELETHVFDRWCVPVCHLLRCRMQKSASSHGNCLHSGCPGAVDLYFINYMQHFQCLNWWFFQLFLMVALWYYHRVFDLGTQFFRWKVYDTKEVVLLFTIQHGCKCDYLCSNGRRFRSAMLVGGKRFPATSRGRRGGFPGDKRSLCLSKNTHQVPFHAMLIGCVVAIALFAVVWRIGEALHPGPDGQLEIMSINPTTVFDREDEIAKLGEAVIGISETAATAVVQSISSARWRASNMQVAWSAPVKPYAYSKAEIRGLAGGTAIVSSFPMRSVV